MIFSLRLCLATEGNRPRDASFKIFVMLSATVQVHLRERAHVVVVTVDYVGFVVILL